MSPNFAINSHTIDGNLYIELKGDFDGTSAWELANTIVHKDDGAYVIVIDTDRLCEIFPFGCLMFEKLIGINGISKDRIVFKGKMCTKMGFDGCKLLTEGKKGPCKCSGICSCCSCFKTNSMTKISKKSS
jgi:hypothetical protein